MARDPGTLDDGGSRHKLSALRYADPIITTNEKKPIQTQDLIRRLKKLHEELSKLEQDQTDLDSIKNVIKDLYSKQLMSHKNQGVKIIVACCIGEILRLHAPNAPYTKQQIKDIFWFIVKQFEVFNPTDPYYYYYSSLIDTLSTVKIIVLVSDLEDYDLVTEIFEKAYYMAKFKPPRNCYLCIVDLLRQLVGGCVRIPDNVVETVLSKFEKKAQIKDPEHTTLSSDLCKITTDNIQVYIGQYFGNKIFKGEHITDENADELKELSEAHKLILMINEFVPEALLSTVTVLREELDFDSQALRLMSAEVLGEMFIKSDFHMAKVYPDAWSDWLRRKNDVSVRIRLCVISLSAKIMTNHTDLIEDIEATLQDKMLDPDEKVRIEVLKLLESLNSDTLSLLSVDTLKMCSERLKDKKATVREKAIEVFSNIHMLKYNEIKQMNISSDNYSRYSWIPGSILETLYLSGIGQRVFIEKTFTECMFTRELEAEVKTEKLLAIFAELNDRQISSFLNILDSQSKFLKISRVFFDLCSEYASSKEENLNLKKHIDNAINHLSLKFPNQKHMHAVLLKLVSLKNINIIKMLQKVTDSNVEHSDLLKTMNDIKTLSNEIGLQSEIHQTFLRRISPLIVDKEVISLCLKQIVQYSSSRNKIQAASTNTAKKLLVGISQINPELFSGNVVEMCGYIDSTNDMTVVEIMGQLLAKCLRIIGKTSPVKIIRAKKLVDLCTGNRVSYNIAKNAAIIAAHTEASKEVFSSIAHKMESAIDGMKSLAPSQIGVISKLCLYEPTIYFKSKKIREYIELVLESHDVINKVTCDTTDMNALPDKAKMKVAAIKSVVNSIFHTYKNSENKECVYKVLTKVREILDADKDNSPSANLVKSVTQLSAASSLLKLLRIPGFYELEFNESDILRIALVVQNPAHCIGSKIVGKICKGIKNKSIPYDFIVLLLLVVLNPAGSLKTEVEHFLAGINKNQHAMEKIFPLLHYVLSARIDLAHDFKDLDRARTCIKFYLSLAETKENIHLLYSLSTSLKAVSPVSGSPLNLYMISDVSRILIEQSAEMQKFALLKINHKTLPYPSKYFKALPTLEAQNNIKKLHIPKEYMSHISSNQGSLPSSVQKYKPHAVDSLGAENSNNVHSIPSNTAVITPSKHDNVNYIENVGSTQSNTGSKKENLYATESVTKEHTMRLRKRTKVAHA